MTTTATTPAENSIPWDAMEALRPGCTAKIDRDSPKGRTETLRVALGNGATVAELARIAEAPKASRGATVQIATRYGSLSRGKAWGRKGTGSSVTWAQRDGGLVLLPPGTWVVGSDDGFKRKESPTTWKVSAIAGVLIAE